MRITVDDEVYATCVHHLSSVGGASTFGWYIYGDGGGI